MSDSSDSGYDDDGDGAVNFALHNAAESGDVETLEGMLGLSETASVPLTMGALFRRLVNMGDSDESTPLHLAIINGERLAVGRWDDGGRTALHWGAASGQEPLVATLLAAAARRQRERLAALVSDAVAAAEAEAEPGEDGGEGGGGGPVTLPARERPEHILAIADNDGFTALHLAAKHGHGATLTQLLAAAAESVDAAATAAAAVAAEAAIAVAAANERIAAAAAAAAAAADAAAVAAAAETGTPVVPKAAASPPPPLAPPPVSALVGQLPLAEPAVLLRTKTRQDGHTPLHLAAMYGRSAAAAALLAAAGAKGSAAALAAADKKGRNAAELARRRGHTALAAALDAAAGGKPFEPLPAPDSATSAGSAAASPSSPSSAPSAPSPAAPTLLLAPDECLLHRTAPEPIVRSAPEPPPENARNAFCAVRPPGHHAGPTGVVPSPNDPHGSHGFCLLSNVAIGAAYAMAQHRGAGIRRVAILDFDVHHGNGTQACVLNTSPSLRTIQLRTPYSEGLQSFPVYKPWMGDGDVHNILFASVQGYGRRGAIGWFYPGSGATADSAIAATLAPPAEAASPSTAAAADGSAHATAAAAASPAALSVRIPGAAAEPSGPDAPTAAPAAAAAAAAAADGGGLPEDPDGEFRGGYDVTVVGGPRVINVGIPGPAAAAAGLAAAHAATPAAAAAAAAGPAPMDTDQPPPADGGASAATAADGGDEPAAKRRRRPAVDYAALNAQLEKEQKEAAAAGGANKAA
ncbi:hypothetical protein GPECTOR_29g41 [Gonium pectorale]|uniref:Histone deacetylase domain-containing protein n=1 Tax=Gonium pectorale TaxID=33097 RepID=A0A150GEQ7_GONPE|nr:hypothetical protein GPECTOR_29g41 [Gonium pectorale]|eukprot:KXZ48263.1 hypothetical protein GPECTOR_29g41 [Gonium pectorale]